MLSAHVNPLNRVTISQDGVPSTEISLFKHLEISFTETEQAVGEIAATNECRRKLKILKKDLSAFHRGYINR